MSVTLICGLAAVAMVGIAAHEWRTYGRGNAIIPIILAAAFAAAAFV